MSLVSPVQIVTGSMYAGGFQADDRLLSTASRNNAIRRETGKVELAFDRIGAASRSARTAVTAAGIAPSERTDAADVAARCPPSAGGVEIADVHEMKTECYTLLQNSERRMRALVGDRAPTGESPFA